MLKVYRDNEGAFPSSQLEGLPSQIIWIDPTDAEKKIVEERVGIQIPSVAALSEIETSSRLVVDWEVMYLSTPVVAQADAFLSPVGFVVTKRVLVTVRFAELTAFNFVAERIARDQSLARIAPFVLSIRHDWIVPEFEARLTAVGKEVTSLNDYEGQLSNKVQSLLDAVLGFISIEQNDLFKVLTIVSVVGIPPTIVVGIYGMNFKFMPELNWAWGYPIALAIVGLSALIPLLWFKWRGWFE
jgi:Mg2+ and Co2+ transporter CorA